MSSVIVEVGKRYDRYFTDTASKILGMQIPFALMSLIMSYVYQVEYDETVFLRFKNFPQVIKLGFDRLTGMCLFNRARTSVFPDIPKNRKNLIPMCGRIHKNLFSYRDNRQWPWYFNRGEILIIGDFIVTGHKDYREATGFYFLLHKIVQRKTIEAYYEKSCKESQRFDPDSRKETMKCKMGFIITKEWRSNYSLVVLHGEMNICVNGVIYPLRKFAGK